MLSVQVPRDLSDFRPFFLESTSFNTVTVYDTIIYDKKA
ncbi:hypothetical protein WG66_008093 [Moniliophthora roreri]|nr:hypothetical protein WG66_008093 [Moniliophthora roreri]